MLKKIKLKFWEVMYEGFAYLMTATVVRLNKVKAEAPITIAKTRGPWGKHYNFMITATVWNVAELNKMEDSENGKN